MIEIDRLPKTEQYTSSTSLCCIKVLSPLEQSKILLSKLDTYACINNPNSELIKEDIGFCCKCNKMIALKFTGCKSCSKNFCKNHREAHLCELNQSNCDKAKFLEGKNNFMKNA